MEEAFEKLKKASVNNAENLTKWMKESKLVDSTAEAEGEAKKLFDGVKDKQNVEFGEFKQIISTMAENQDKSMDQFTKMLSDCLPRVQESVMAAASALKDAFK